MSDRTGGAVVPTADVQLDSTMTKPLTGSILRPGLARRHPRSDAHGGADARFGTEKNPPVYLYDTSGPYTDSEFTPDLLAGLPALREQWILERGDCEELPGLSSESCQGDRPQPRGHPIQPDP